MVEQSIKIGVEDKNKMKNNEYLSVKQFSERAGVSSQAVYKQLNNYRQIIKIYLK